MQKIVQSKHMEENARGERDMPFTGNMGRKTQDKVDSSKASQDTWIKRCKVSHMSENMQNKGKTASAIDGQATDGTRGTWSTGKRTRGRKGSQNQGSNCQDERKPTPEWRPRKTPVAAVSGPAAERQPRTLLCRQPWLPRPSKVGRPLTSNPSTPRRLLHFSLLPSLAEHTSAYVNLVGRDT
jgi:hypothetical protein